MHSRVWILVDADCALVLEHGDVALRRFLFLSSYMKVVRTSVERHVVRGGRDLGRRFRRVHSVVVSSSRPPCRLEDPSPRFPYARLQSCSS